MRQIARVILALQPVVLVVLIAATWLLSYQARMPWLLLYVPVLIARLIDQRRLWVRTPLDIPLLALLLLANINHLITPFTWGWEMSGRITFGIVIVQLLTDIGRGRRAFSVLLLATSALTLGVGLLALVSSQWIGKSSALLTIAQAMPVWKQFPGAEGGFNVNEIGGALAWFVPFAFALLISAWSKRLHAGLYGVGFAAVALAIALGQSRMAIAGVLVVLFAQAALLIPRRRWKVAVCAGIVVLMLLEIGLVAGVFDTASDQTAGIALNQRDEQTASMRFDIWSVGLRAIMNYPITGIGINKFRAADFRDAGYTVVGYPERNPPHAHNELLHVTLDMGLPGLLAYVSLHVALAWCLWQVWRGGDVRLRGVAVAVAGGLLAHAIFGLADAVTLADRWIWAFWWLVGLGAAVYVQHKQTVPRDQHLT
ncbi:MAG: O-antigen ligase family protein [Chloroflexi bacterium]|uniref:O-antigen ligase family protein n=1 Tax=Candidatus Flexifilum breve TaxID=3140694 RepID=UPI0031356FB5|nr:O-antigen ligase family protein [Chloroflexota bacterium]